jgi:uncharacterized RDD family membrane protein YckC
MDKLCINHPSKKSLSFCHNCGLLYCEDCLLEGDVYYYCKGAECSSKFAIEKENLKPKPVKIFASFTDRIVAIVFDYFFIFIIGSIIAIPFYYIDPQSVYDNIIVDFGWFLIIASPWGYFFAILYFPLSESGSKMGTLGKRWQKVVVVNQNVERISLFKAFLRNTLKFISFPVFILFILGRLLYSEQFAFYISTIFIVIIFLGYFLPLIYKYKQTVHDLICGTFVIEKSEFENLEGKKIQICSSCDEVNSLNIKEVIKQEFTCSNCKSQNTL